MMNARKEVGSAPTQEKVCLLLNAENVGTRCQVNAKTAIVHCGRGVELTWGLLEKADEMFRVWECFSTQLLQV